MCFLSLQNNKNVLSPALSVLFRVFEVNVVRESVLSFEFEVRELCFEEVFCISEIKCFYFDENIFRKHIFL